jgi:putative nucleotidyltransferase with HDIG domain
MTDDVPASQRWRGRPVHSLLLQAFVFAIPIVASVAAATAVSAVGPRPQTLWQFVGWWVVLTAVALVVLLIVDRLARKLLPLATLLKLSMLFPDRAPSRFRVARNAASVRKLSEQLADARERGLTAEPVWAAETVLTLLTALGHHDRRSRGHSERVHVYTELLAEELDLPEFDRDRLRWAALLHDVGKLVIPAELLNKPGQPDREEWDALRKHPEAGAELCAPLLPWLGEWGQAIAQHHEWFDGTGYPAGLSGLEISRAARVVAVADCYEVMTTSRTYKRAMNPAAAREELARCAGTQFDPAIVRAFLNVSLGRLRLAMGPLAMLSTVPSMARLTSLLEPLARAGAVFGGAAIIVGGGSLLPSDATADATPPASVDPVITIAEEAEAPRSDRVDAARVPAGATRAHPPRDDTEVAGTFDVADDSPARPELKLRREKPASTPIKLRPAAPDGEAETVAEGRKPRKPADDTAGSDSDDPGTPARGPKPGNDPAGDRPNAPARDADPEPQAAAKPEDGSANEHPGGAQPTPPDGPPGAKADREYDDPPANPDPPGRRNP